MGYVGNSIFDVVSGRSCGHGNLTWEPGNCIGDALSLCVSIPDGVTVIGMQGRVKVPTVNVVGCPTFADTGLFMDDDADAGWSNGGVVEVKRAM